MPIALAVAAGIALDRYGAPWSTFSWGTIALAAAAVGLGAWRRGWAWDLALLIAFAAIGGGWHHHRWSDVAADDLSRRVSETPRPAWVRGVLREVLGKRPGTGPGDPGTTRAVLELTEICDGQHWHGASGRAQLVVAGDRSDLRAGAPVQAAGACQADRAW
jgi:competence protein ComEC